MDSHSIDIRTDRCSCRGGIWDSVCAGLTDVNFGGGDSQWPASNLQSKGRQLVKQLLLHMGISIHSLHCNLYPLPS